MDYIHDDEDVFEMIPPVDAPSVTLEDPREKSSVGAAASRNADAVAIRETPCHQRRPKQLSLRPETKTKTKINMKTPLSAERNIVRIVIAIAGAAVALGLVIVLFGRGGASRDPIEVLRLEFKRDLESLRSDVEHELGAHLLAAAAVQRAASARAIELEREHHHNSVGTEASVRITQVLSTIEFPTGCSPQDILRNAGHRLQEGLSLPKDFPDTILRQLQTIYLVTITSDWIQGTTLRHAINFANQHSLEACVWFAAFLLLLYNCYRSCCRWVRGTDRYSDHGIDDTAHDSSNPMKYRKGSDECPTDSHVADGNSDPQERNEDAIMEHMFDESVAAAVSLPVIVEPRIYTGGNRTRNSRHQDAATTATTPKSVDPSPTLAPVNSNSKKERRIRARINAQEFAARDKQRLTSKSIAASTNATTGTGKGAAAATKPNAQVDASVLLAVSAAPALSPSPALPSTWISKRARLKQARANAKLYAEQDKQRLREAAADDPWKKYRRKQQK